MYLTGGYQSLNINLLIPAILNSNLVNAAIKI